MYKMINSIQNYAWGSHSALTDLYGIQNLEQKPMAELWMGAHPLCSSKIQIQEQITSLHDAIAGSPMQYLGESVYRRFGELPFLFKVLCAAQPLSVQVHPNKAAAEVGYARENSLNIPLTAENRNYKDANHKPELIYALTPFRAMNGFRSYEQSVPLFEQVVTAHSSIGDFVANANEKTLSILFSTLLTLNGTEKQHALQVLKQYVATKSDEPWQTINEMMAIYPEDMGLFSPLLLNLVELQVGEAMFLYAETPHAYLQGSGLEVMANSDNVLRAGLTAKYIDVAELVANVKFKTQPIESLKMVPQQCGNQQIYPIPVKDFTFAIQNISQEKSYLSIYSAAILFCVEGQVTLNHDGQIVELAAGGSCFIPAIETEITLQGMGRVAVVSNDLEE